MPEERARLLYVEDDPTAARIVREILEKEGHEVGLASSAAEGWKAAWDRDLLLLDLNLPDGSGLDLLAKLRVPAIVVTASDAREDADAAVRAGAVDYLTKPIDPQRLAVSVANALRLGRQQREIARLRSDVRESHSPDHLVGGSPALRRVRDLIRRAAASDAGVLVAGESGTGKELAARALHFSSPRASGPFVDVNSAALTDTLLESELFGHEKGSFTNAHARRRGKFEQAHGGTLFLDEIGDMPGSTQAKILRVLQERSFQRVGGEERIEVDVRVVCATNRNLEEAVHQGGFRKDLFYRINAMVIEIPPLRERGADIPELARHFLGRETCAVEGISVAAMEALCLHSWPGNVRELQHALQRAVLVCEGAEILPEHLPPAVLRGLPAPAEAGREGLVEAVERLERSMIVAALDRSEWVKARAARDLGVTERILAYKMQNLGIERAGT